MLNNNFKQLPYWLEDFVLNSHDIKSMLDEIPKMFIKVKKFAKNSVYRDHINGYIEHYRISYITECNLGENTGTQTDGETQIALANKQNNNPNNRNEIKTVNLSNAMKHLFGDSLIIENSNIEFKPDLAKALNKIIGDGLFEAGFYRTTDAKAAGADYCYIASKQIDSSMESLFGEINKMDITPENWYEVAAYFFERFLYIHPFCNGNGRTARLLLSVLLKNITIVPLSLYIQKNKTYRDIYINCLEEYRLNNKLLLHSLIIQCTHVTLHNFIQALYVT